LTAIDVGPDVLRKRLAETDSAEARKVLSELQKSTDGWLTSPVRLREVRAVEALQRNPAPAAKALLKELAAGDSAARLTREAREALR
jgi:hypothetical protein